MAKMFFSLGFWMTIVFLFVLAYVIKDANGAECPGAGCAYQQQVMRTDSLSENAKFRAGCASQTARRESDLQFRQSANLQAADTTYAPGLSFSITHRTNRLRLCAGPIEIPPHY